MSQYKEITAGSRWTICLRVPVEFGKGAIEQLGHYLNGIKKALVVTGHKAMKSTGVTDRLCKILGETGVESRVFNKISPEPKYEEIEEASTIAKDFGADIIIGCGGGSVIDAAKAIAVAATHPGSIMEYIIGGSREITKATLPVVAISSTSGTGSHVGRVAVLLDNARKIKRALASDYLFPKVAICDTDIFTTMPPDVTASSGFDAFAHALEGYLSNSENPMGNVCAKEALRIIYHTLPKVIQDGDNLYLRSEMSWADTLAGISLATNAVVIPHVLSMVIGGRYRITHALAVASVIVSCLKHSREGAVSKLANIARIFGCQESWNDNTLADWTIETIAQFIADIGLKKNLIEYGVPTDEFYSIAEEVLTDFKFRVDMDPVPTDVNGVVQILDKSVDH